MFTIIFKPTLNCNLACRYCYIGLRKKSSNTSIWKAKKAFSDTVSTFPIDRERNYNIIFHGGEPTLLGESFFSYCYDKASKIEQKHGISIKRCIQTNLVEISKELLQSLYKMGYEISSSLDGTEKSHDTFRVDKKGRPTFQRVINNIKSSQDIGFSINAICCVNKLNLDSVQEVYDFFNSLCVNPKFNYLEFEDDILSKKMKISPQEYSDFLLAITKIWLNHPESQLDIMPTSDMISALINGFSESCIHAKDCQRIFVCIGPNSDVWPCGKCFGIAGLELGSLDEKNNGLISYKRRRSTFGKGLNLPKGCKKCKYLSICNGLCPYDLYAEHRSFNLTSKWCKAYKILWPALEEIAEEYKLTELISEKVNSHK